jgi:hypothetical protein
LAIFRFHKTSTHAPNMKETDARSVRDDDTTGRSPCKLNPAGGRSGFEGSRRSAAGAAVWSGQIAPITAGPNRGNASNSRFQPAIGSFAAVDFFRDERHFITTSGRIPRTVGPPANAAFGGAAPARHHHPRAAFYARSVRRQTPPLAGLRRRGAAVYGFRDHQAKFEAESCH